MLAVYFCWNVSVSVFKPNKKKKGSYLWKNIIWKTALKLVAKHYLQCYNDLKQTNKSFNDIAEVVP